MRKAMTAALAVLLLLSLLSGCHKTPDSPIIKGKDHEGLIAKAEGNDNNSAITQMLNAPSTIQGSESSADGTLKVTVDAKVTIPNATAISTIRVGKRPFGQEDVDKAKSALLGDDKLYPVTSGAAGNMSKSEMEAKIIELRQKLDAFLAENPNVVGGEAEQTAIELRELEAAYETAPENGSKEPISTLLSPDEKGNTILEGITDGNSAAYCYFSVQNYPALNLYKMIYTSSPNEPTTSEPICFYSWNRASLEKVGLDANELENTLPALAVNNDMARNTADKSLEDMGISDMVYDTCNEAIVVSGDTQYRAYVLEYVRAINGTPIHYTDNQVFSGTADERQQMLKENSSYAAPWAFEKVEFIIDDTGIRQFVWESPYVIGEPVAQNTKLLSFDEIQSIFMKMILITNIYQSENADVEINISEARLGLMRITEENSTDTALLVPVWDFFGTVAYKSGGSETTNEDSLMSRLSINAIDGTIIDRTLGY